MKKKKEDDSIHEEDIDAAYAKLVEAVVLHALDKATIPDEWRRIKISQRMRKMKWDGIQETEAWLTTKGAQTWFAIYETAMGIDRDRVRNSFINAIKDAKKFLSSLPT